MRMGLCSTAAAALMTAASPVWAQTAAAVRDFDIPGGPLGAGLAAFARQSGDQILYPAELVAGRTGQPVRGQLTSPAALERLLEGSGLAFRQSRPGVFVLQDPARRAGLDDEATVLDEIIVTGTLLRGAADGPSPVVVVSREGMDRRGHGTVADALSDLSQNFGGSGNEAAISAGADRGGGNSTYASGVNLRGLGSDATLVLINGRRLAGSGNKGDFADISTIPASAVSRIDVLLDGASALYGPDLAEDIFANCGVEVVFGPKDLKTAQDLSERIGAWTYAALSRSRPKGLGAGRRSVTTSDQRRPLMLPQELLQMPASALIVLKAGLPAVRGRKIAYYREAVFRRRLRPAPRIDPAAAPASDTAPLPSRPPTQEDVDMDIDAIVRAFAEEGLPPPSHGASESEVRDWLDRVMAAEPAHLERHA